jgi:hypothetical protein
MLVEHGTAPCLCRAESSGGTKAGPFKIAQIVLSRPANRTGVGSPDPGRRRGVRSGNPRALEALVTIAARPMLAANGGQQVNNVSSVPLISLAPNRSPAVATMPQLRTATIVVQQESRNVHEERRAAVMALKAGLVFLVAYFGLLVAILVPAIANEAPGKYPGLWRYVHAAPNWVTRGAACEINLETHEQWLLADHAVHQLVDPTAACDEEAGNAEGVRRAATPLF